ncbi:MAG: MFS transporter, partial [Prevotellaceae bacterium]|nr:MFS transporter [Prevotellaceae bacterium]
MYKWRELIPNNLGVIKHVFSSLGSRNYRLYFTGQCISVSGTWMQQIAMSWLIYRLTGSLVLLATVNLLVQLPSLIISPFSGVVTDRFDKHKILVVTQLCMMVEALTLAALMFTDSIAVWHIMALGFYVGIVSAIDNPARQALTVELVDKKDISNAVALNSAVYNGARLVGPSIGGLIVGLLGEGFCFLVNGVSYIAVVWALLAMRLAPHQPCPRSANMLAELGEGFRYIYRSLPIKSLLVMVAIISCFGMPFTVLIPAYVAQNLSSNSEMLGFLMSVFGAGALVAAIYLAARKSVLGLAKVVMLCTLLFGICYMALAYVRAPWLALLLAFPTGFGLIAAVSSINTLLQTLADDDKRGRTMSIYVMVFIGMTPLGSLLQSWMEKHISFSLCILIYGAVCAASALVFERYRPVVRRLSRATFVQKGIVPEIAEGIRKAAV